MSVQSKAILPRYERRRTVVLLAAVGGFLDAYTYLIRGGVFANAQTGNIVLFGISLADKQWQKAGYYLIPVIAFFAGVLLTEWIKKWCSRYEMFLWEHVILILEFLLLIVIGFCPESAPDWPINITVSFVCAVQVHCFRKVHGLGYASTMCTGNLRSAAENFFRYLSEGDKRAGKNCGNYLFVIGAFMLGAAAGAWCVELWSVRSVWVCCILLLGAFLLLLKKD